MHGFFVVAVYRVEMIFISCRLKLHRKRKNDPRIFRGFLVSVAVKTAGQEKAARKEKLNLSYTAFQEAL